MRALVSTLVMACVLLAVSASAHAQTSCKLCADQQKACMKNYAGPACSTEYKICMKSCKK
jgi:hypothetical protein